MEYKASPASIQQITDRTVTGFAAVSGNIDLGGDRLVRGAFTKTLGEGGRRAPHLWQHDMTQPPIATITDLREVGRADLPADVLAEHPAATGGLLVSRRYLETPRADEVFQGIKAGAIQGMSFGYEVPKGKKQYVKAGDATIREIAEVKLIEVSDTPFPMNPASRAQKSHLLYSLLDALDTAEDMTALLQMGQGMTPEQLAMCQQCVAMCLKLLQNAVNADSQGVMAQVLKPTMKMFEIASSVKDARALLAAGVDFKAGRMISAANQAKIRDVIDAIEQQLETLEDLVGAAEPPAEEAAENAADTQKALTDPAILTALMDLHFADFYMNEVE